MSGDNLGAKAGRPKGRWLVLVVAAVAGLGIGAGAFAWRLTAQQTQSAPAPSLIGGPFQMVDAQGRTVDQSLLKGKWTAVFFGYTYCPDVCPGTLQTLQAATGQLGGRADDLQVVFVSVDPARDTPEALRSYLASFEFPGGVHGLTGTPEQVEAAAKAYRAYYRKRGEGPDYLMDHASTIYLMDPEGRFARPVTGGMDPKAMAEQISAAMKA
jgi:protein SCO1/2